MRALFAIVSLVVAGVSTTLDVARPSLLDSTIASRLCREGLCRYDQVLDTVDAHGMDLPGLSALLNLDPSNPLTWCNYAELLSNAGQTHQAASAFEQALALGPGMSPVLMRAASFDFIQGREDRFFATANRILTQTDAFDQTLFSYFTYSRFPVSKLAGVAVPPVSRAAKSWFSYLRGSSSDTDLHELWCWMRKNHLLDQKLATEFAWTFWQRKAFTTAQDLWADWLGPSHDHYLHLQRLANVRFQDAPNESPFDWTLTPALGVEIRRSDGLDIRFSGTGNITFANVSQFTTVSSAHYRFSAQIRAENVTTDQGPFFHIFDPVDPARLSVESSPVKGTVARSWITLDAPIPPATQALEIRIERRPSHKFDNKISGSMHVYEVSLLPVR
jgi:hypothetical protein